jgi:ATP-binding cassette subfamily B protein
MRFAALRRVRPFVRPYRRQMGVMLVCALVGLVAATLIPLVLKDVIDGPIPRHSQTGIALLAALALALGLVDSGSGFLRRLVLAKAALGMETDMRNQLYAHLQRLPVSFHDGWQSGQLLSRATTDLPTIRRFVGFGLVFLIVNTLTYLLVVALLVTLYWPLAILVGVAALPVIELSRRFERRFMVVSRRLQDQNGDLTTVVEESATGIRVTKAFGRAPLQSRLFARQAERIRATGLDRVRLIGGFWAAIELVPNVTLAAVLLFGGLAVARHALTLGGLVAFVSLVLSLAWPVDALGWIIGSAEEAETAAARVFEVLDLVPAIADRPHAVALGKTCGRVRFEDVGFTYPGTESAVLDGVDLELAPGETVALVGATGSGKSSLAMLVPRLYDATAGRVTLDGHDIRDLTLASLRRHVAVAFEDAILFSASVRENLLLGYPHATDRQLAVAIDTARAGFVYDLPWGLDTRVGEQGLTLSGGQRQRLALARAIVGRPRVLVLDDPLSALDVHTESLVEAALAQVLQDVTALLVVHRPSTIALADRVAFLDGRRIVATGQHGELMAGIPAYRAILSESADGDAGSAGDAGDAGDAGHVGGTGADTPPARGTVRVTWTA